MAERNADCARRDLRESVCINVDRVYDCCKDRDCITDARVYVSESSQQIIDRAVNVKAMTAEVLWTYIDVEALPFNRGFYTVDIKIFFRIGLDVFANVGRPQRIYGLATFDKRVILYGSEGNVKTYSSSFVPSAPDTRRKPTRPKRPSSWLSRSLFPRKSWTVARAADAARQISRPFLHASADVLKNVSATIPRETAFTFLSDFSRSFA